MLLRGGFVGTTRLFVGLHIAIPQPPPAPAELLTQGGDVFDREFGGFATLAAQPLQAHMHTHGRRADLAAAQPRRVQAVSQQQGQGGCKSNGKRERQHVAWGGQTRFELGHPELSSR